MITNLKSVVRTPDPVQQIIKIGRKPPIRPWSFQHHWQVTELQQAKSLVTTYAATTHPVQAKTSNHQLSSLWKKKLAARPGCPCQTYFGQIFVINGKQSVVRELILWFLELILWFRTCNLYNCQRHTSRCELIINLHCHQDWWSSASSKYNSVSTMSRKSLSFQFQSTMPALLLHLAI